MLSCDVISEVLFKFLSENRGLFINLPEKIAFNPSDKTIFLSMLSTHKQITACEIQTFSDKDKKLLYELINQQITLFSLDKVMTFPESILYGCSKNMLGYNMIMYLAETGFLFPQTMRDQSH